MAFNATFNNYSLPRHKQNIYAPCVDTLANKIEQIINLILRKKKFLISFMVWLWFGFMVFNATFNNISVISWQSILLVEETGVPGENHRPVTSHWQTFSHNVVHLTMNGIVNPTTIRSRPFISFMNISFNKQYICNLA